MKSPREVIESHYAAGEQGDLPGMFADFAPDIVWTEADGFPLAGTYVGTDAVRENVFVALAKEWDGWAVAIDHLVVDGETVVGLGTYTGTNKATGKPVSARVAHIWRVEGGRAVRFEQITDTAQVLDGMR
ncbi:nuclear transport factor 2 family protein [Promicromonospora sp. NPDC057138]|uniref:nuclear transport factor 2 family protein n=1 Tax=Promicromonospora sp. NPDC057138 TaxID=3346031 RepID=UPI00363070BF